METPKTIETEFYFQDISPYGSTQIAIPEGYEFFQFITKSQSDYNSHNIITSVIAVYKKHKEWGEVVADLAKSKGEFQVSLRKEYDQKFAEQVKNMKLEQAFSDILTKFKLGDYVYYYSDGYGSYGKDDNITDHIKSFSLASVVFEKSAVSIQGKSEPEIGTPWLVLKNWNEQVGPHLAYKTKEEAIEGSKAYHQERMDKKEEERANAEKLAAERKQKEEEEILKKAEEIKNKKV